MTILTFYFYRGRLLLLFIFLLLLFLLIMEPATKSWPPSNLVSFVIVVVAFAAIADKRERER